MLSKVSSWFFETSEEDSGSKASPDNKEKPEQAKATQSQVVPTVPGAQSTPPVIISSGVNEEMVEFLFASIQEADLPGFDYPEFKKAMNAMANVAIPEPQKFQTVFGTASVMGLTKEKLLSSIDHYQEIIYKKKEEFGAHVQSMIDNEVTSRQNIKAQKEQEIEALSEQIKQAQAAIAERQQEILQISNEINKENMNIQQTSSSFEATYNFVNAKLEEDKNKINSYIQ